jgi:hypothetical protein
MSRQVFDSIIEALPKVVERAMDLLDANLLAEVQATVNAVRQNGNLYILHACGLFFS